jgi:hypothetical protein
VSRYGWLLFLRVPSAFGLIASVMIFATLLMVAGDGGNPALVRISGLASRLWEWAMTTKPA